MLNESESETNTTAGGNSGPPEWYVRLQLIITIVVPTVFGIVFVVGLLGNGTLIYTILANKWMRTKSNVFIVSLAAGDFLLILVSVPFAVLLYTTHGWWYGAIMCKLYVFLQTFSLAVSVLTLTALSGDRLVAIVFPLYVYKSGTMRRTVLAAIAIWILSLLLAVPDLVSAYVETGYRMPICRAYHRDWGEWYAKFRTLLRFVVLFAVPLVIITVFYSIIAFTLLRRTGGPAGASRGGDAAERQFESRRKVANIVLTFIGIFVLCWLPRHIFLLCWYFVDFDFNAYWHVFKASGFCLTFVYSASNPFALYVINDQFRRYFNHYLCGRCMASRRLPPNYDRRRSTWASTTGQVLTTQQNISLEDLMDRARTGSLAAQTSQTPGSTPRRSILLDLGKS